MQRWLRVAAMEGGATLTAPETVQLSWDTRLAPDVTVGPHTVFGPGVVGRDRRGDPRLQPSRGLRRSGPGALVGPYARLRPGTVLEARRPYRQFRRGEGDPGRRAAPRPTT